MAVKIFFCYAREDEALLNKLKTHLKPLEREGVIELWHDREISAGMEWERAIDEHLNDAQVILLLVSPDFMASNYCYGIEMHRAMERHERAEAKVIPIILRPVYWQGSPFGKLQALPTDSKPIKNWPEIDDAFYDVTKNLHKVLQGTTPLLLSHPSGIQSIIKVPHRPPRVRWLIGLSFLVLLVVGLSIFSVLKQQIDTHKAQVSATATTQAQHATATAFANTPQGIYNRIMVGTPVLIDPLSHNDANNWIENTGDTSCFFSGGAYHAHIQQPNQLVECGASSTNFSNLAYQVQMTILKGDGGGITFRFSMKQFLGYSFYINQDGTYAFYLAGPSAGQYLRNGSSPFIKTGLNQTNLIAVVARGSTIYLYVNKQYITSLSDNTFSSGQIGVLVNENSLPTEVMFQNVQVWNV